MKDSSLNHFGVASRQRDGGGQHLQREKDVSNSSIGPGMFIYYGKRFCENCQQYKPKGKKPAFKGWKCDDCSTNFTKN